MITNINETKTNLLYNPEKDAIKILEDDEESNNQKTTELPLIKKEKKSNISFDNPLAYPIKYHNRQKSNLSFDPKLKNYAEIRDENRTMKRLVSVSLKNLDLRKILEREKLEELKKFNFIERLLQENNQRSYHEKIFEKNPLEKNDIYIKNRNQIKIRNKKLSMNNILLNVQKSSDYIVKNIKKAPNIYDLHNSIKLKILEKDVEMQRKFSIENNRMKAISKQNQNEIFNNNFKNNNINFNNIENNFTNTHITITNQTNFIKETINSILDESISTQKIKCKNISDKNNNKEDENNFFNKENKKINFDFDEIDDNISKSNKKNIEISSNKNSKINNNSNKKIENKFENFDYTSNSEEEEKENKGSFKIEKDSSRYNLNKNNKNSDINESSIFDINADLKSLENKKEKNNSQSNKKSLEFSSNINDSSKNLNVKNDKSKITRNTVLLLDPKANLDLKKIDNKKLIHNIYDLDSQRKIQEFNNNNNSEDINNLMDEDAKSGKHSNNTSEQFFDEDKIQKLDDSGVLKPVKYESVYFKSIKKIQGENNLPNPSKLNPDDISLINIEPHHKTKKEIEQIKNTIKDIMKRRFDFSDEYLNDLHKKLQKKIIDVDPNYESVKNKYSQYKQQKILAKKECETAMKLHVMNKNPIMQVNNSVTFPMIINDPMLLASVYNLNMFNLEYTNNQIK